MDATTVAIAGASENPKKITKTDLKLLKELELVDGIKMQPPPEPFAYDEGKRLTQEIARRWSARGWIYENRVEESFCLAAAAMAFNQAGFDNFIEERLWDSPIAQKNLEWVLRLRAQAIEAFKKSDKVLMRASLETMHLYQQFITYDESARGAIEFGLKFKAGRKPGVKGPLRKAIEALAKKDPKISAAKAWKELAQAKPFKMEFTGGRPELREVWLKGKKLAEWPYFQKLLSKVKKELRQ